MALEEKHNCPDPPMTCRLRESTSKASLFRTGDTNRGRFLVFLVENRLIGVYTTFCRFGLFPSEDSIPSGSPVCDEIACLQSHLTDQGCGMPGGQYYSGYTRTEVSKAGHKESLISYSLLCLCKQQPWYCPWPVWFLQNC